MAALAANKQGKFWAFHHKLFQHHKKIDDAKIQDIAIALGLDLKKFKKDMASPAIAALINRDLENGRTAGIRGTPTVFINGKLLKNMSLKGFSEIIEAELKRKG